MSNKLFEHGLNNVKFNLNAQHTSTRYVITCNKVVLLGLDNSLNEKIIALLMKFYSKTEIFNYETELISKLKVESIYYNTFFLLILKINNAEKCDILFRKFSEIEKQNGMHKPIICCISSCNDQSILLNNIKNRVDIIMQEPISIDTITKVFEMIHNYK